MPRLTLATALATGDLEPFIQQAEADNTGPADRAQFDGLLGTVTAPLRVHRTSHLPARGLKRGK